MRKLVVLVGVLAVLAAGCGESKPGSGSASGSASVSGSASGSGAPEDPPVELDGKVENKGIKDVTGADDVAVELDDNYFSPTFIKVKAGQSLKVELHNEGKATHTFTVPGGPDETVQAGEKKTVTLMAPAAATVYYCRFHRAGGMQGALYLKDGEKVSADAATTPTSGAGGYGY